jgi:iron complex outermembrane receptor protein
LKLLFLVLAIAPQPARLSAQQSPDRADLTASDIIVTAQRRPERQLDVPAAITVLQGATFETAQLADTKEIIRFTPGFSGFAENNFVDGITIRGIATNDYGIGGDPSIGIFRDGIHQGRTGSAITTAYDLDRVEALRGPQVFLFGRNAISGALSVVTKAPDPDANSGYIAGRLGTRARIEAQGAYNLALGAGWALRVAGDREKEHGSAGNFSFPDEPKLGSRNVSALRASLLHHGEATTIRLTGEYEDRRIGGTPHRAETGDTEVFDLLRTLTPDIAIGGGPRDVDSDLRRLTDHSRVGSLTFRVDHDINTVRLTSLTGLRTYRYRYLEDYDGTPLLIDAFGEHSHGTYASQEFTATSRGNGVLRWSVGVSGYFERVNATFKNSIAEAIVCGPGYGYANCGDLVADVYGGSHAYVPTDGALTDINRARSANWGLSAYGEADWSIFSTVTVGVGARFTRDHKRFDLDVPPVASTLGNIWLSTYYTDGYLRASKTWDGLSPRIYVRWQPDREWTVYASGAKGTKAGGFGTFSLIGPEPLDSLSLAPAGTRPDDYSEEAVRSAEIGVKGRLPRGLGSVAVTAFHYVYGNLQANVFDPALRSTQVINIGKVYGSGIESEAALRLGAHLDLSIEAAWTHTRKKGYRDCTLADCGGLGNPAWSGGAILRGHVPFAAGEAYVQGEASYSGRPRASFDDRDFGRIPACGRGDVRVGYAASAAWGIEGFVRNVTNALCYSGADSGGGTSPATLWGPIKARSGGVSVNRRF